MIHTAPATIPSIALFRGFLTIIDRLLMSSAQIAIRNGEPTYFGL